MKRKIKAIVIGSGGHARVLVDIAEKMNTIEIIGVLSNSTDERFLKYEILGDDLLLPELYEQGIRHVIIGIGGFTDNIARKIIFNKIKSFGFSILNLIHPSVIIGSRVKLGTGVVLFAGVVLNPDVIIGDNVIIATGSSIDHETVIEDHCLISAGVTIGACVLIGSGTLCALGCKVVSQIEIGKNSLLAAGATVVNNLPLNSKAFGIPAKNRNYDSNNSENN